jgi:histidine triad (HIT) family protein
MTDDCIFCKIIAGKIPSAKVYENDRVLAFLDIMPINPGHTLVIPKHHSENIYSAPEEDLEECIKAVKIVAKAVKKGVDADGVIVSQSNEKAAGQVIGHIHFHIIPRFNNDGLKNFPPGKYKEGQIENIKEKIIKSF